MNKKAHFQKYPRKPVLALYNLIDKIKFGLNIKPDSELVIVSGADSTHFKSLVQFIKSVQHYESDSQLVIYDLGMTNDEVGYIRRKFPTVNFRIFDYGNYPSYFNIKIDAGKFAWKPVIISDVLQKFRCSTIWFDAGCILTQPLYRIRKVINNQGFYSPLADPGTIKEFAHPQFIESLHASEEIISKISLAGGMVAINHKSSKAIKLVEKWKACALEKKCCAPEGANRRDHRFQTIMSILAYQMGLVDGIPHKCIGFLFHQDID